MAKKTCARCNIQLHPVELDKGQTLCDDCDEVIEVKDPNSLFRKEWQ